MSKAKRVNIEIEQGTTFSYDFPILNTDGTDFDVTGWSANGQLRKHYASNTAYTFTTSLSNGHLIFSLSSSNSALISFGLYVYDVKITNDGTVKRLIEGMATVSPQVTT